MNIMEIKIIPKKKNIEKKKADENKNVLEKKLTELKDLHDKGLISNYIGKSFNLKPRQKLKKLYIRAGSMYFFKKLLGGRKLNI